MATATGHYFRVVGEDGRVVHREITADALRDWKARMVHLVHEGVPGEVTHSRPMSRMRRQPAETFTITPLDRDRVPVGKPETWRPE